MIWGEASFNGDLQQNLAIAVSIPALVWADTDEDAALGSFPKIRDNNTGEQRNQLPCRIKRARKVSPGDRAGLAGRIQGSAPQAASLEGKRWRHFLNESRPRWRAPPSPQPNQGLEFQFIFCSCVNSCALKIQNWLPLNARIKKQKEDIWPIEMTEHEKKNIFDSKRKPIFVFESSKWGHTHTYERTEFSFLFFGLVMPRWFTRWADHVETWSLWAHVNSTPTWHVAMLWALL